MTHYDIIEEDPNPFPGTDLETVVAYLRRSMHMSLDREISDKEKAVIRARTKIGEDHIRLFHALMTEHGLTRSQAIGEVFGTITSAASMVLPSFVIMSMEGSLSLFDIFKQHVADQMHDTKIRMIRQRTTDQPWH